MARAQHPDGIAYRNRIAGPNIGDRIAIEIGTQSADIR
jgi:hypothetical protein